MCVGVASEFQRGVTDVFDLVTPGHRKTRGKEKNVSGRGRGKQETGKREKRKEEVERQRSKK